MKIIEMIKNLAQCNSVVASADVLAVFEDLEAKDKRIADMEQKLATPMPAVTNELLETMDEVIRISDRDHEAWSRAKEAIATCRVAMLAAASTQGENQ